MNKNLLSIFTVLLFGASLIAQDKAEITVKITKDGELVKDTTYHYDDIKKAKHAIHMMEMISSEDIHFESSDDEHRKILSSGDHAHKKMMFISKDGDIKEVKGDDMHWVTSTTSEDGNSMKVHLIKMMGDADCHDIFSDEDGENETVFIIEEDGKVEVIIKKIKEDDCGHKVKVHKKVIVISDDEKGKKGSWTIKEGDDGKVIVISEDGKVIEMIKESHSDDQKNGETLIWVSEGSEGDENVKVTVIKKGSDDEKEVELEVIVEEVKEIDKKKKKKKNR